MTNKNKRPDSRRGCLLAFGAGALFVVLVAGCIDSCASPTKPGDPISTALVWLFLLGALFTAANTDFKEDEDWFG